ncbi:hypothetical protein SAMN05443582_101404 [Phyllobacterium sp. OV277]|nr:hypothetical protein SAMN05443582_101404 [Phyllobacterium sp. OV277]
MQARRPDVEGFAIGSSVRGAWFDKLTMRESDDEGEPHSETLMICNAGD